MHSHYSKKLIEEWIPLEKTNACAIIEAAFKQAMRTKRLREYFEKILGIELKYDMPKLRNLHVWPARRPTSAVRVLNLAATLPEGFPYQEFERIVGFNNVKDVLKSRLLPILTNTKPKVNGIEKCVRSIYGKSPNEITILDPMAGGGSIPLESLRLGFRTIAIEYSPLAYLLLKATIEFPAKYADSGLFELTLQEAKRLIEWAKNELSKFYALDAENYIIARGIRCPVCEGLIPIALRGDPEITKNSRFKNRYLKIIFDKEKKNFIVETTNSKTNKYIEWISQGKGSASQTFIKCPYCEAEGRKTVIKWRGIGEDTAFNRWCREHAELMRKIVEEYVQFDSEVESKLLELHIPLIKQVGNSFKPAEVDTLIEATKALCNEIMELIDYIPIDEIPKENEWARPARDRGLDKWYMLFNPRQLYVHAKLIRYLAKRAEELVANDGELGAAVILYLAFGFDKVLNFNSIATIWQGTEFRSAISPTIRGKEHIEFLNEYCELVLTVPERSLEWALEVGIAESGKLSETAGGVLPVVKLLCDWFKGLGFGDRVIVYLGDATRLSEFVPVKSIDVINVDPPYYQQVDYADELEFLWVWLRRVIKPIWDILFPSDRVKLKGFTWSTSAKLPRERQVVAPRGMRGEEAHRRFESLFKEVVNEFAKVLKDDGVLVLWFTHPTDRAWKAIGKSLYDAGFVVTRVWPIYTEHPTRYQKQVGMTEQETSLIIVARKLSRHKLIDISSQVLDSDLVRRIEVHAEEYVRDIHEKFPGVGPGDIMALVFGSAMALATRLESPVLSYDRLFNVSVTAILRVFTKELMYRVLKETGHYPIKDGKLVYEIANELLDLAVRNPTVRSYLALWIVSRVDLIKGVLHDPVPIDPDFAQTIAKLVGADLDKLEKLGLVKRATTSVNKVEEESEETTRKRRGKAVMPILLEALAVQTGKQAVISFRQDPVGQAIELIYRAMIEKGLPKIRASKVKETFVKIDRGVVALAILLAESEPKFIKRKTQDILSFTEVGEDEKLSIKLTIETLIELFKQSE